MFELVNVLAIVVEENNEELDVDVVVEELLTDVEGLMGITVRPG